jgi:hypothetical protein
MSGLQSVLSFVAIALMLLRAPGGRKNMADAELEEFKRADLRVYASSQGYELDRRESWASSAVMRHANGDKIIIKRDADGHYVYFSVRDERDNGTIIDFIQHRRKMTLGRVRQDLRSWLGNPRPELSVYVPLATTAKDRIKVEAAYGQTRPVTRHPYLERERRIPASLLESERFAGTVRIDLRGNAVFPHFDEDGLCGFELRNRGFQGFAAHATKGLWFSGSTALDDKLVVCESAVDAMSYAALFPDKCAQYASIGGKPNPVQPKLISAAVMRLPVGGEVIAAMDADKDGRALAHIVETSVAASGRLDLRFTLREPDGFKDWNDQLRGRPQAPTSSRAGGPSLA